MTVEVTSLIVTALLAIFGYLAKYINDVQIERRKEQLELINKQINEFYGPLYIASVQGQMAFQALAKKLGRRYIFIEGQQIPENEMKEWKIWLEHVLMPLNTLREELILKNAHLIREREVPSCLLEFAAHVASYKAMLKKWDAGDYSQYTPLINFPGEVTDYAARSYRELKAEQLKLIGKRNRSKS